MHNYIFIMNEKSKKFNDIQDIIKYLLGEDYYSLNNEEQVIRRYENAFNIIMTLKDKINIVHTLLGTFEDNYSVNPKEYDFKTDFIIDTDITYLLSLARLNQILLLEKINCNRIIPKEFNVNENSQKDNYIVVNTYANKLMLLNTLQEI